jgi:hypothetical protein
MAYARQTAHGLRLAGLIHQSVHLVFFFFVGKVRFKLLKFLKLTEFFNSNIKILIIIIYSYKGLFFSI